MNEEAKPDQECQWIASRPAVGRLVDAKCGRDTRSAAQAAGKSQA
jgi:hypothetical protein